MDITVDQALELLKDGKCIQVDYNGLYVKLFRNDTIMLLMDDKPVAATVKGSFSIEEFVSIFRLWDLPSHQQTKTL